MMRFLSDRSGETWGSLKNLTPNAGARWAARGLDRHQLETQPCAGSLVVSGRGVAGGVLARDAVGLPVRRVTAAVHRDDRRGDALLQPVDLETALLLLTVVLTLL